MGPALVKDGRTEKTLLEKFEEGYKSSHKKTGNESSRPVGEKKERIIGRI